MAFTPGVVATFSFNGTDISAYVEKVEAKVKRDDLKLPRIGGNAVARLVGSVTTDLDISGWFDPVIETLFTAEISSASPTSKAVVWKPQGATGPTWTGVGQLVQFDPDTDATKAGMWKATIAVDGAVTFS